MAKKCPVEATCVVKPTMGVIIINLSEELMVIFKKSKPFIQFYYSF